MDAKEYLDKFNKIHELIISNIEEIKYLNQLLTYAYKNDLKLKIEELENTICEELEKYIDFMIYIRRSINKLKNVDEMLCLKCKYVLHYSNKQIQEMNIISDNSIVRVHSKALKHLDEILRKGELECPDK